MTDARPRRAAPRPAAVLWDMDGTIVDTEPYWIEAEYEIVAEFGDQWDDAKAHSLIGHDLRDSARIMQEAGGVRLEIDDIVNRLLDGVIARVRRKVPWRPGAREMLAQLRVSKVPCALVTMSWSRFADAVVATLPPGTFAAVISGEHVSRGKPDPEPYVAAAHALGVRPKDCVAIEDSPTGARSAAAAGCRTFVVPNVVDVPDSKAWTKVDSLLALDLATLGIEVGPQQSGRKKRRTRRTRTRAFALAVLALLGAGAVWALRNDSPPPLPDIPMQGWAPYWVLDGATSTVAANGALYSELSPFWFETRSATDIGYAANVDAATVAPFLATARASGADVLPAVSIADALPAGAMAAILADPASRTAHVQALVALAGDFDGLDLDYEQFAFEDTYASWASTRPDWVAFVDELATALHAQGKLLTVTVPPIYDSERNSESGFWVYDYAAMGDIVDRIRVMAYDYSVAEPGPIAPLGWVRTVVRAAKHAVDDDTKVVLGVPLYGRNWVLSTDGTCPADTPGRVSPTLPEVEALITQYGAVPTYDENTGESSFTYLRPASDGVTSCTQTRQVNYVDADGALARVDLARKEHIGGVAFWALGFDTPDVWTVVGPYARPRSTDGSTS